MSHREHFKTSCASTPKLFAEHCSPLPLPPPPPFSCDVSADSVRPGGIRGLCGLQAHCIAARIGAKGYLHCQSTMQQPQPHCAAQRRRTRRRTTTERGWRSASHELDDTMGGLAATDASSTHSASEPRLPQWQRAACNRHGGNTPTTRRLDLTQRMDHWRRTHADGGGRSEHRWRLRARVLALLLLTSLLLLCLCCCARATGQAQ